MKKTLRFFGMLAFMMIASSTVSFAADFEGSVNLKAKSDGSAYNTQAAIFSFTDVAATLETDSATLSAALTKFMSGASDSGINFEVEYTDAESATKTSTNYTQGSPGGFWMNINNEPINWGDGCIWYNTISFQTGEEANEFFINIGLYPGALIDGGGTLKAKFILTYNEKTVSFEVTANVAGKTKLAVEPETVFANLEVVASTTYTTEQFRVASSSQSEAGELVIADLLTKLGVSEDEILDNINEMVYIQAWNTTDDRLSDNLIEAAQTVYRTGLNASDEAINTCYGVESDGEGCAFFLDTFGFDTETGTLLFNIGQSANIPADFDSYNADLFIVYGKKAYKITVTLNVKEREKVDFSQMTKAGEEEFVLELPEPGDTTSKSFDIDLATIAEALGVNEAELVIQPMQSEGVLTTNSTANNGGFWFNTDGYVTAYGNNSAMYVEPTSNGNWSKVNVGQYTMTAIDYGKSCTSNIYVLGSDKYYVLKFTLKIKEQQIIQGEVEQKDWKLAGSLMFDVQLVHKETYSQNEITQIDMERMIEILGGDQIDSKSLYTWKEAVEEFLPESLTNAYSCTPYPGFWMSSDGKTASTWGASCAYGMTVNVASGEVSWYDHDARNANAAGDTYEGKFYIANKVTGNVCELVFNISFVDTRQVIEIVGTENVEIILSEENFNGDYYTASNDFSKVFEALNINADLYPTGIWYGQNERGGFTVIPSFEGEDAGFDANGVFIAEGVDAIAAFAVGYDEESSVFVANVFDEITDATKFSTKVAYEYDGKRYVFNIKIGSAAALAINNINTDVKSNNVYDLSGRLVRKSNQSTNGLMRGIYMIGGKKVMIK